ncbi:hypothetical protein [Clostridium vincentii]|nr:hypothetical protein [Clostridium vincentii]
MEIFLVFFSSNSIAKAIDEVIPKIENINTATKDMMDRVNKFKL